MKTRILSSLVMIPFVLFIYLGGIPLMLLNLVVGEIAIHEFLGGYRKMGEFPYDAHAHVTLGLLYVFILINRLQGFSPESFAKYAQLWIFLAMASCLIIIMIDKTHSIVNGPVTAIALIYTGFFSAHVSLIDCLGEYRIFVWVTIICTISTDVFAYFTGMLMGKHKLCPNLSPKKTIEGSIGGVVASAVFCALFGYIFAKDLLVHCMVIGLVGSGVSQCGDLIASAFKRKMGIKDYGNLIPGHGGVMDRFDSLILTAPFVYYYIIFIIMK